MNPSNCIGFRCVDEDNRELPENSDIMTNSSQLDALSFYQSLHRDIALDHSPMSDRSMPTLFNLEPSPNFIIHPPMPPVCHNSPSSAGSDFTTFTTSRNDQLFVRILRDVTISIDIDKHATIADLKQAIFKRAGIPPRFQHLISGIRESSSDSRLNELCLTGNTVTLHLPLLGGAKRRTKADAEITGIPRIMPMMWWFGFGQAYQDGRAGQGGRVVQVVYEFKYLVNRPKSWNFTDSLYDWLGICWILSADRTILGVKYLITVNVELTSLPESIGNLIWLIRLDFSHNLLTSLPESIGNLTLLEDLFVSHNRLEALPDSVGRLMQLSLLYVGGNPVTNDQSKRDEVLTRFGRNGLRIDIQSGLQS